MAGTLPQPWRRPGRTWSSGKLGVESHYPDQTTPRPEVAATPAIEGDVMGILDRSLRANSTSGSLPQTPMSPMPPSRVPESRGPRSAVLTRTNAAWFGLGAILVVFVCLCALILQNTGTVEFSFLWLRGPLSVAVVLVMAIAGGVILAQFGGLIRRRG
jgi:uncharacterized integral membrane protein